MAKELVLTRLSDVVGKRVNSIKSEFGSVVMELSGGVRLIFQVRDDTAYEQKVAVSQIVEKKVTSIKQAQYELIDVANSDDGEQTILDGETFGLK